MRSLTSEMTDLRPNSSLGNTTATREKLIQRLTEYIAQASAITSDGAINQSEHFTDHEIGVLAGNDVADPVNELETQTRCLMQLSPTIERNLLRARGVGNHMNNPKTSLVTSSITELGANCASPGPQLSSSFNQRSADPNELICHWREEKKELADTGLVDSSFTYMKNF